ncbi:hypothetical protein [Streptomyces sp. Ag109_G2-15]|uniref:hypothetical protein n=1 Tax=Streptomyces sp. Ag109_G2-15 TaxID=1938850 RepID=UPI00117D808F|nr:hypothetical protein [Streptomyces sp. Ag109_G2-15]
MPTDQQFQQAHQAWVEHFADKPDAPGGPSGAPLQDVRRQMPCKNCGVAMDPIAWCVNCRWEPGLIPVAQMTAGGSTGTTFVSEQRHKFMAASIMLLTFVSIIGVFAGFRSGAGVVIISLIGVVAGIAAWKYTRLGRVWWGLSTQRKMASIPAITVGGFFAIVMLPITLFFVFVIWQVSTRRF